MFIILLKKKIITKKNLIDTKKKNMENSETMTDDNWQGLLPLYHDISLVIQLILIVDGTFNMYNT